MENIVYTIEIDDEFVLINDLALGELVFKNNLTVEDLAQRFMISVDDVKEILCG